MKGSEPLEGFFCRGWGFAGRGLDPGGLDPGGLEDKAWAFEGP